MNKDNTFKGFDPNRDNGGREAQSDSPNPDLSEALEGNTRAKRASGMRANTLATDVSDDCQKLAFLDWLTGSFPSENLKKIQRVVAEAYDSDLDFFPSHGLRHYEHSLKAPYGVIIGIGRRAGSFGNGSMIDFSATALKHLTPDKQLQLFKSLYGLGFRCSRIDLSIDDYAKDICPNKVAKAYHAGNIKGFKNTGKIHGSGAPGQFAFTFSLGRRGSKGSGKYLTFYDKEAESGGEINANRVELSLSREYAKEAFHTLSMLDISAWADVIFGYINWSVNFINRSKNSQACRCPQLYWWKKFLGSAVRLHLSRKKQIKKNIDRLKGWLEKQIFPSFYTVFYALSELGQDPDKHFWPWFWNAMTDGRERINDSHKWAIDSYLVATKKELYLDYGTN